MNQSKHFNRDIDKCVNRYYDSIYFTLERYIDIYLNVKETQLFLKMVVPSFSSKISASDNEIAEYRYLPCIQHQKQTAVTYGWRAATRDVRQPPFLKSQSSKIVHILRKKRFRPISGFLKAKG